MLYAAAAAILLLSSCTPESADIGREKTEPPIVDEYLGLAEEYCANGDTRSAINTLEQGYSETASKRIKNRLDELKREFSDDETK